MFGFLKKKLKTLLGKPEEDKEKVKEIAMEEVIKKEFTPERPSEKPEEIEPRPEEKKKQEPKPEEAEEAEKKEALEEMEEEVSKETPKEEPEEEEKKQEIIEEESKKEVKREEPIREKAVEKVVKEGNKGGLISKVAKFFEKKPKTEKEKRIEELAGVIKEKEKGLLSGLLKKISEKELSEKDLKEFMDNFELVLIENNVALEVVEKISSELKNELIGKKVKRSNAEKIMIKALKNAILSVFNQESFDIMKKIETSEKKPFVITVVGFNGVGKTTSLAKLAYFFKKHGKKVVLAAGDTFRAAALEQIEIHAKNIGVAVIKHKYGADSAAVIYDAIEHAKSKNIDIVIADTAGRNHADINLMDELKKIKRVDKPDLSILVIDTLTGNDAVEQAKHFDEAIGVDGIILAKADVAEKAGAALSVGYVIGKPVLFMGTGQNYEDLKRFDAEELVSELVE